MEMVQEKHIFPQFNKCFGSSSCCTSHLRRTNYNAVSIERERERERACIHVYTCDCQVVQTYAFLIYEENVVILGDNWYCYTAVHIHVY